MNTAQLQAWVQQNKTAVLGVAGAGVVALALRSKRNSDAGDVGGVAVDTAAAGSAWNYGPAAAGTVPYDSTSTDVVNTLTPIINRLYEQQEKATTPTPLPDPGYYRLAGASSTYYVDEKGNRDWLTAAEYNALGRPSRKDVPRDSFLWTQTKLVGDDHTDPNKRAPTAAASPV